jgi:transposase
MNLGVSATAIAREHGLNANLVHRWVREYEKAQEINLSAIIDHESVDMAMITPNFIELPFNTPAVNTESEEPIQLEFQRGDLKLNLKWPAPKASECVHLIKALLKC